MHEQHPVFEAPTNPDVPIWRYMDLAKFVSMLEAEALHFSRADNMSDEFEGSVSAATVEYRFHKLSKWMSREAFEELDYEISELNKEERFYNYLNCWHMNEHESAAMWNLYQSGEPRGIAIRSTYRRLSDSLTDARSVYIGIVKYIHFASETMPDNDREEPDDGLEPYIYKRKSFEHERELRAFHGYRKWLAQREPSSWKVMRNTPPVVPIDIELDRLVESVYVSPKAPAWFAEVVTKLSKRYGRKWAVRHSDLDEDPVF